jgi:GT2 family glycosyltransferase
VAGTGDATIVVVPRERFSMSERALENLYENTDPPFSLVYVDGNSPPHIASFLRAKAAEKGFKLVRTDHYLTPNQARNLGLGHVETKYAVFIDNDAIGSPGWLEALVRCAEETGAWVVGPLYFEGEPDARIIHVAGGRLAIREEGGKRIYADDLSLQGTRAEEGQFERTPCDFVEFHCALVRREAFDAIGPLDERLLSTREHVDLCMSVRKAGGSVYFEPDALVTYLTPPPLLRSDLRFFLSRWSESRNEASLRHFYAKWGFDNDVKRRLREMAYRRLIIVSPVRRFVRRRLGRWPQRIFDRAVMLIERPLNRLLFRLPRGA